MKERRIEHTYDCSAEVFWNQLFLDDEYNRKLFVDELHFSVWRVVRLEERGTDELGYILGFDEQITAYENRA